MKFTTYEYRPVSMELTYQSYHSIVAWLKMRLPCAYRYEHFGSTAIPIAGKGVVDIACLYPAGDNSISYKQSQVDQALLALTAFGCEWHHAKDLFKPHRPRVDIGVLIEHGDALFVNEQTAQINVHIHLIEAYSAEHLKQRYFRQRLLLSPALCVQYIQYKAQFIEQGHTEHQVYGEAKGRFVKQVLQHFSTGVTPFENHTKYRNSYE